VTLGAQLRAFKAKSMDRVDTIVRETTRTFAGSLVTEWTPLGDPLLWKNPPPADYKPGNLRSSWFLSFDQASTETTLRTDIQALNHAELLEGTVAGRKLYITNNADHAGAIENAHSTQAPIGIMWAAGEFPNIAERIAKQVAG
jgi:hypothetical protein